MLFDLLCYAKQEPSKRFQLYNTVSNATVTFSMADGVSDGVFVKVSEKDVPPGADKYVMIRVVDVQRLTQKVVSAKNAVSDLRPRLGDLCTSNELSQQGIAQLSEDVKKKLNITSANKGTKSAAAAAAATEKGADGGDGAKKGTGGRPKKRKKVVADDDAGDISDGDSDASEMQRDAKRSKAGRNNGGRHASQESSVDGEDHTPDGSLSAAGSEPREPPSSADERRDDDRQIDYTAKPGLGKNHRVVRPVVHRTKGKVGVCVLWDIPAKNVVKIDESVKNAEVDRELRSMGATSMEKLWRINRTGFAELFENVVQGIVTGLLRDVVKEEPVVFVENGVKIIIDELGDDEFIQQQPQPLRTAMLYARKTFFDFRHEEDERRKLFVRAVKFVKPYLDRIRGSEAELVLLRDDSSGDDE